MLKDKGFLITSIDEEAGLDMKGYREFSKTRFSKKLLNNHQKFLDGELERLKTYTKPTLSIHPK